MNIPPITSIENALTIYYNHAELGNAEITALFGRHSSATIARLKQMAKDEMIKRDIRSYGLHKVNTVISYSVWGIDVMDLEKRRKKLKDLELQ